MPQSDVRAPPGWVPPKAAAGQGGGGGGGGGSGATRGSLASEARGGSEDGGGGGGGSETLLGGGAPPVPNAGAWVEQLNGRLRGTGVSVHGRAAVPPSTHATMDHHILAMTRVATVATAGPCWSSRRTPDNRSQSATRTG